MEMKMTKKDWCSWTGIATGAIALMLALTHFMAGPFSPQPSLESLVAAKAVAIKYATIAALQGKEVISSSRPDARDGDRIVSAVIAVFAAGSIIFGALGGLVRNENPRAAMAAALLGFSTIALQFAIMALCVILLIVLVAGVINALCG